MFLLLHQVHSNEFKAPARALQLAPPGLSCALRSAFHRLDVPIMQTFDCHLLEVATKFLDSQAKILISGNLTFLLMNLPDLHMALPDSLQLKFAQSKNSTNYGLAAHLSGADQLARTLNLHPARLPLLAVLLGAVPHLLSTEDLQPLYTFFLNRTTHRPCMRFPEQQRQVATVQVICNFLRELGEDLIYSVDNLSALLFRQFVADSKQYQSLCSAFAKALQYFCSNVVVTLQELRKRPRCDLSFSDAAASCAHPKSPLSTVSPAVTDNCNGKQINSVSFILPVFLHSQKTMQRQAKTTALQTYLPT